MSSVALIHLHRVEQKAAAKALSTVLAEWKFKYTHSGPIPPDGPGAMPSHLDKGVGYLCYLLGPRQGNWTTLIQPFADREDTPFLADVANRLSQQLQTHSLALLLHEGDVLFYNLDYRGTPRDGYCSNPQHLADHRLDDKEVLNQRHQPKAFTPLLPRNVSIDQLQIMLQAGWWQAFDAKQLDEAGELLNEEDMIDEEERMNALGNFLQLNGNTGYPLAYWKTTKLIDWKRYQALYYSARGRTLTVV